MRIDFDDRLDTTFPKEAECDVNETDCEFKPVEAVCHECGKKLCRDCGVGIRHQPQLVKYLYPTDEGTERIQMHCPGCADTHSFDLRILGGGLAGVVLGLVLLSTRAPSAIVLGLVALVAGAWLLRNEYRLKTPIENP